MLVSLEVFILLTFLFSVILPVSLVGSAFELSDREMLHLRVIYVTIGGKGFKFHTFEISPPLTFFAYNCDSCPPNMIKDTLRQYAETSLVLSYVFLSFSSKT